MKKSNLLILTLASALLLGACGKQPEPEPEPQPGPSEQVVKVESVSLNVTEKTLRVSETFQLEATVLPADATNKNVTFKSSKTSVATVSATGLVEARAVGVATITVTTEDGNKIDLCTVQVQAAVVPVESVSLDLGSVRLPFAARKQLTATVLPETATNKAVTWSSSDNTVAEVDQEGLVTAKSKAGNATIIATTVDGGKTAMCNVQVVETTDPYIILTRETFNGYTDDDFEISASVGNLVGNLQWSIDPASTGTMTANSSESPLSYKSRLLTAGTVTLIAKDSGGETQAQCVITINQSKVNSISLSEDELNLFVGGSDVLVATVDFVGNVPESERTVTWESSDPTIATVSNGRVEAKLPGHSTITARAGEKHAECEVTVSKVVYDTDLVQLKMPSWYTNGYQAKTANLDDVDDIQTEALNLSTFFENEEGKADSYKVGSENPFKIHVSGVYMIDESTMETEQAPNPYVNVKVELKGEGNTYSEVGEEYYTVSGFPTLDTFQFTPNANGKHFRITFSGDTTGYSTVEAAPLPFEFDVFDGWNVYDKKDLIAFDTRDVCTDDMWPGDHWAKERQELKDAGNYPTSGRVNGMAIHRALTLDNSMVPNDLKYSEAEVDEYIANHTDDFRAWIALKTENGTPYTEESAREALIGSPKDFITLFYRDTHDGENFYFEGNYNTLNFEALEQGFAFGGGVGQDHGAKLEEGTLSTYQHTSMSRNQIFGYNCEHEHPQTTVRGGNVYMRNLTVQGNGRYSSDDLYMGGYMIVKTCATDFYATNFIVYNSFMAFLSQMNSDYDREGIYPMYLDRCKSYGSYNSMCYTWGTQYNYISNSYFEKAGGALFLMDDVNYSEEWGVDEGTGQITTMHAPSKIYSYNCKLENKATGTEPWFVMYNAAALLDQLKTIGGKNGYLGKTAVELQKADPGETYNTMVGLKKDESGNSIPIVNIIAIDMSGGNIANDTKDGKGHDLEGAFYFTDENFNPTWGMDLGRLKGEGEAGAMKTYKSYFGSNPGMIFESSTGANSMLGDAGGGNGFSFLPTFASINPQLAMLPYFHTLPAIADLNMDGEDDTYITLGGQTEKDAEDNPIPVIGADALLYAMSSGAYTGNEAATMRKNMVKGNYMASYIKPNPSTTGCYLGCLLGMFTVPEEWLA